MRRIITLNQQPYQNQTKYTKSLFAYLTLTKLLLCCMVFFIGVMGLNAQCLGGPGRIGGIVFGDYNLNGVNDQVSDGVAGIEVQLFGSDADGESVLLDLQITDSEGLYTFSGLTDGSRYRVEFTVPESDFLFEGFVDVNSQSSVQFVTAPNCDIDLGMANPFDYCDPDPLILVPCFINGDPLSPGSTSANGEAIVIIPFDAEGTEPHQVAATAKQVGSTYGITTLQSEATAFASAFVKRHVGLGPLGVGGIYKVSNVDTPNPIVEEYVDLVSLGLNFGNILSNTERGLPINQILPSNDPTTYSQVATAGIGGLDISDDESTLWFVNMFDKTINSLVIDADGNPATAPTSADLETIALPDPGCANGSFRPFSIRYYRDKIYVGGVCDAFTGTTDDLEAIVYGMDLGGSFEEVLRFDLDYMKGIALRSCVDEGGWFPWTNDLPEDCTGNNDYVYPTPVLSSLVFDIDGSLVMGFMDRTGNQLGYLNYGPEGTEDLVKTTTGGDILRASLVNGEYQLESNGSSGGVTTDGANNGQGPGGGEYYHQDIFTNNLPPALYPHNETAQGGLALVSGSGVVISTALDPFGTSVNSGGLNHLNNMTGEARDPGYLLFSSGTSNSPTFGKANGLGAITISCGEASLEIGNLVWIDNNANGVQDPSELPIPDINVTLYNANGLELATVQTDANGNYLFNDNTPGLGGLEENTDYTIVVGTGGQFNPNSSFLNDSLFLTLPNVGMGTNTDLNDSDGTIALFGQFDGLPVAEVTTGGDGQNNHSYDFGFVPSDEPFVGMGTIMGRAFKDCNNNGIRDSEDLPLSGLTVRLTGSDNANNTYDIDMTTNVSGVYTFEQPVGTYVIIFEASNGLVFIPQDVGDDDTIDSDISINTGASDVIVLAADQTITNIDAGFSDIEAPSLSTLPENITVSCADIPNPPMITATDNCQASVEVIFTQEATGDDCSSGGILRTWRATDPCGNSTIHTQMIVTDDDEAPILSSMPADVAGDCGSMPAVPTITATDNCTSNIEVVYTQEVTGSGCSDGGILRTWTATDDCGNSTVHTQTIQINDDEAPILSSMPADVAGDCGSMPAVPTITATDNCTSNIEVVYTQEVTGSGCSDGGILRTWTATDDCGNSTVHTQTIQINDDEAPILSSMPADVAGDCGSMPAVPTITATDNCTSNIEVVYTQEVTGSGCSDGGILRTWTATDDCGNSTVHTQTIQINDDEAPILSNMPADMSVDCGGMPDVPTITATDNCTSNIEVVYTQTINGTDCTGGIFRTWTATDDCGNSTVHTQTIFTEDNEAPVLSSMPANILGECGTLPEIPVITATDNCSDNVVVIFEEEISSVDCNDGGIVRRWTATDDCGNSTVHTQKILLNDEEAPILSDLPMDIEADCELMSNPPILTATDNCDGEVEVSFTETMNGTNCSGGITRTWTATDDCGNSTVHTQVLTILDDIAPVISFTNPLLVGITNGGVLEVDCENPPAFGPTDVAVTDNCDANPDVTFADYQIAQGVCAEDGYLYILTCGWTAVDACGNTTEIIIDVHIVDHIPPVFTKVPEDITLSCMGELPAVQSPEATDNCTGNLFISYSEAETGAGCGMSVIRTWTTSDKCGNASSVSQTIVFNDTDLPQITNVPMDITLDCGEEIPTMNLIATDNCGDVDISFTDDIVADVQNCTHDYTLQRTWTVSDGCGNTTNHVQQIRFEDNTPPVLTFTNPNLVDGMTIEADCTEVPGLMETDAVAIDNCDNEVEVVLESMSMSGTCEQNGYFKMFNYIWTATDDCGNASSLMITLLISDLTAPEFDEIPEDITVSCGDIPFPQGLSATDNCGGSVEIAFEENIGAFGCAGNGGIVRMWTAIDACGNSNTLVQNISIEDTVSPVLENIPNDIQIACGESAPNPNELGVTASDNCDDEVAITIEIIELGDGDCSEGVADIEYVFTAMDDCGNMDQRSVFVSTIPDTTPPVITGVPSDLYVSCGDAIPTPADYTIDASDNCDDHAHITMEEVFMGSGNCISGGPDAIEYMYVATDHCGNSTTASFTVFFEEDTEAPVFLNIPADQTINCDEMAADITPEATDNCDSAVLITFETMMTAGDCASGAEIIRTWIATDACGNVAKATQLVTIADTEAPTFAVNHLEDIIVECDANYDLENITALDNCIGAVTAISSVGSIEPGACEGMGIAIVEWTATDACGNSAIITQRLIFEDTTAPEFDYELDDITVECDAIPSPNSPAVSDNCSSDEKIFVDVTDAEQDGICEGNYTILRRYTATDACGNASSFTQTIRVEDTTAPIFVDLPTATVYVNPENGDMIPEAIDPIVSDNCSTDIEIDFTESTNYADCNAILTRTWIATDACGNTTSHVQEVFVAQLLDLEMNTTEDSCEGEGGSVTVTAMGKAPYHYAWSNGDNSNTHTILNVDDGTYTVTVTDANGCIEEISATVADPDPEDCIICGATIGDFVFWDYDQDGIQDVGEPGIGGVTIHLINTTDNSITASTETDNLGFYEFVCVPPGTYVLEFVPITLPDNADFTEQDQGDNDELDSDANPDTGQTDPFTIVEGQDNDFSFDAGIIFECINVTDGGEICCDQQLCGSGAIAETIMSQTPASGGVGEIEYIWMQTTLNIAFDIDNPSWTLIAGANEESYDPGAVFQTTYYTRCARSKGCESYVGETDIVVIEIVPSAQAEILGESQLCITDITTFEAVELGVVTTYSWTFEGAVSSTSNARIVNEVSWDTPGIYTVTLITENQYCTATTTHMVIVNSCAPVDHFVYMDTEIEIANETEVLLNWEVMNEAASGVYAVEYNADGTRYETIALIEADSTNNAKYQYLHQEARVGMNIYRIKYVDAASNFISFSADMEVLINPNEKRVLISPNPFEDKIKIELLNTVGETGDLQLINTLGQVLLQQTFSTSEDALELDLTNYPQGTYFVMIQYGQYKLRTYKIVKAFE